MRDERERRDGRDGRELRLMHESKHDVRGSKFRTPRTSDLEPSSVPLFPPAPPLPPILLVSHAERAEQTQREACAIFADGLTAFLNRAWGQARAIFQQCIGFTGKDGPAQFYLTLCDQYLKTPPPQKNPGTPSSRKRKNRSRASVQHPLCSRNAASEG
jgi:hypothetical protein